MWQSAAAPLGARYAMNAPAKVLLSLDFEDRYLARIRRLTENEARLACEQFVRKLRESILPQLQTATAEELCTLVEEMCAMREQLKAQAASYPEGSTAYQGESCKYELLDDFIRVLRPYAARPTPPPDPPAAKVIEAEPECPVEDITEAAPLEGPQDVIAAEWAALQRELGEEITAATILQKMRDAQDQVTEMRQSVEELQSLKDDLLREFGTTDPRAIGAPREVTESELRDQLQAMRAELIATRVKLRDLEAEFDEADPVKVRRWIRRMRDELYSKERVQARILSERTILAAEFKGLDAPQIVALNRSLKKQLAEAQALNQTLQDEYSTESALDLETLLGDVESALSTLNLH